MWGNEWDELITPASPAAQAFFTRTVPGHTFEKFLSVRFTLAASAAAANRFPFVAYTNGDGIEYYRTVAGAPVTAGLTVVMTFSRELDTNPQVTAGFIDGPARDETLPSGYHLVVGATAMDVADQISAIQLWTKRYPTGPMAYAEGARALDPREVAPGNWS